MSHLEIYKKTENFVKELFEKNSSPIFTYHNLAHTEYVVGRAKEIAGHYQLTEKEMLILFIACWFHDAGYLLAPPNAHEEKSVALAKTFMETENLDDEVMAQVADGILATRHPSNPQGLLQEIICDADTYNLGTKSIKKNSDAVFEEWKIAHPHLSYQDFLQDTVNMLKNHRFYTSYCQENLNKRKEKNAKAFKKELKKLPENEPIDKLGLTITAKQGTRKCPQTLLRATSSNLFRLSEMADAKANILIFINAIIILVILFILLSKLQTDPYLTIPTLFFLLSSVITIVISILATRPQVSIGRFNEEDMLNKKTNLLFFGNFHKMKQIEYENALRIMMQDSDYLYSSMVADIYHLGTVLGRKNKLVRWAYNVFMVGILFSVLAFTVTVLLFAASPTTTVTTGGWPF